MSIFYHILGVFAGINERLSRQTVNFIQINWILIGFSFFGFTFALGNYFNSVDINKSPEPISIEDIEKSYNNNIKYVTVKGLYDPYFAIEYGNRSKGSTELNVTDVYIPIVEFKNDAKSNLIYGVYIKQDKDFKVNDPKEVVEITGMIENLNYHVKDQLDKIEDNKGINTSFSINPKGSPPNSNLAILILIGSIIPAIGFGYTWIKRYKIIQSNSEKILPSSVQIDQFSSFAEESKKETNNFVDGELTGKMFFEKGGDRKFYFIPTRVNFLEDGSVLCASNIDASSTFFGFKTKDREGIWTVVLKRGDIKEVKNIYQYFGLKKYPGILIKFAPGSQNKELVLAFEKKELHKDVISKILNLKS